MAANVTINHVQFGFNDMTQAVASGAAERSLSREARSWPGCPLSRSTDGTSVDDIVISEITTHPIAQPHIFGVAKPATRMIELGAPAAVISEVRFRRLKSLGKVLCELQNDKILWAGNVTERTANNDLLETTRDINHPRRLGEQLIIDSVSKNVPSRSLASLRKASHSLRPDTQQYRL
ncbi:uncharacterized protein CLUP02_14513 [Colletotrichum lupini]|uniref:Uncharacterized protein n=1 Tax=Colletotrichum lupini TaxID=145971 RepID=A0A9Q8WMT1_9PEZI|nr:uncharacterized protein CLUP02_14513 [Colletotrichum lupini]UQC88986.1 hypothetical protein CLUP02_14513 [Colletotrichum lupini]